MPGLKRWDPAFGAAGNKVASSEMDQYQRYHIILPGIGTAAVGTAVNGGTSSSGAIVFATKVADYPRNVEFNVTGTGDGIAGTAIVNGKDQFGRTITETIDVGTANLGGTTAGTKVFAQFTSGSIYHGTHLGPGTATVGYGTTGTTALFGLPDKLGGTTDVISITASGGILTGGSAVVGGTVGAQVNVAQSAIKARQNVTGTTVITVLYKPSYDTSSEQNSAALAQVA